MAKKADTKKDTKKELKEAAVETGKALSNAGDVVVATAKVVKAKANHAGVVKKALDDGKISDEEQEEISKAQDAVEKSKANLDKEKAKAGKQFKKAGTEIKEAGAATAESAKGLFFKIKDSVKDFFKKEKKEDKAENCETSE